MPACEVASPGACDDGSACVPPSFATVRACVMLPPATPCPADYPQHRQVALGGSSCDCACEAGPLQCDTVSVTTYPAAGCTGVATAVPLTPPCTDGGSPPSVDVPATVPATSDCTASGTVADPTSTATLCCRP